jgi:hypothetical protein
VSFVDEPAYTSDEHVNSDAEIVHDTSQLVGRGRSRKLSILDPGMQQLSPSLRSRRSSKQADDRVVPVDVYKDTSRSCYHDRDGAASVASSSAGSKVTVAQFQAAVEKGQYKPEASLVLLDRLLLLVTLVTAVVSLTTMSFSKSTVNAGVDSVTRLAVGGDRCTSQQVRSGCLALQYSTQHHVQNCTGVFKHAVHRTVDSFPLCQHNGCRHVAGCRRNKRPNQQQLDGLLSLAQVADYWRICHVWPTSGCHVAVQVSNQQDCGRHG